MHSRSALKSAISILLAATPLLAQKTTPQDPLTSLQERNRVLLLFAPTSADARFTAQQALLKNQASKLHDLDLIVIPALNQWTPSDNALRSSNPPFTTATEQIRLRNRYHLQPLQFAVILLGKDGGEKLRSSTPVTMEKLTGLIDSMPMRQQELRQRDRKSNQ